MRNFAQEANIFPQVIPVDLAGGANAAVGRIDMAQYSHVELVIVKNAGIAGEPVVVTVEQHKVASAGTPKALSLSKGIYVKAHANIEDATAFVKEAEDSAGVYTATSSISKEAFITIPIDAEMLDVDGGYHWLSASIADTGGGGACLGTMFALAFGPRYTPPPNAVP